MPLVATAVRANQLLQPGELAEVEREVRRRANDVLSPAELAELGWGGRDAHAPRG